MNALQRIFSVLLIFSLLTGAGWALHQWGQQTLNAAQVNATQLQQQRQATGVQLSRLQNDLPQVKQDIADFEIASLHGWWKAEDRLRFSEGLTRLVRELRLQKLDYGVAPREVLMTGTEQGGGAWQRSPIELQVGVQHEGQLLSFIEAFPMLMGGVPVIQECVLSRPQAGSDGGNLSANCKGVLYSYHPPTRASPVAPPR